MTTSVKNNFLPPALVSNLQEVLSRKGGTVDSTEASSISPSDNAEPHSDKDGSKPVVLITNGDGIESPGLTCLVEALVREGLYNVHVCAPQSDKSASSHSMTLRETIAVNTAEICGATAYEVSGTPVDCVSLALSGALFSWSKPLLVISGINRGSSCGHHMFYSGVVAGAREALICGVPSISISLNWKKDASQESDFKDAVTVCLPLINAAIRDIEKGSFPNSYLLNIEVPTSPLANKGFKVTKQSMWRSTPSWLAVSANRHHSAARFMSNQQSLGMQLAQLSRDASAAGAARRLTTQRKSIEVVESVGVAGNSDSKQSVKYFRLEIIYGRKDQHNWITLPRNLSLMCGSVSEMFMEKAQDDADEDLDFRALENGFVAITPLSLTPRIESDTQTAASDWISTIVQGVQ